MERIKQKAETSLISAFALQYSLFYFPIPKITLGVALTGPCFSVTHDPGLVVRALFAEPIDKTRSSCNMSVKCAYSITIYILQFVIISLSILDICINKFIISALCGGALSRDKRCIDFCVLSILRVCTINIESCIINLCFSCPGKSY